MAACGDLAAIFNGGKKAARGLTGTRGKAETGNRRCNLPVAPKSMRSKTVVSNELPMIEIGRAERDKGFLFKLDDVGGSIVNPQAGNTETQSRSAFVAPAATATVADRIIPKRIAVTTPSIWRRSLPCFFDCERRARHCQAARRSAIRRLQHSTNSESGLRTSSPRVSS